MKNCEENKNQERNARKMDENPEEKFHDEIAKVAYHLWEISGKVPDKDLENWENAKKIVLALHENDEKKKDKEHMGNANMKGMMGRSEMMKKRHMKNFGGKENSEE
ncbi:MAG: DUF2934 domain-containing protein [Thermotogae bacterium]|jgi:hypothetical protein|nr:DUF2934 domain-containing protein [Thermotogota bacterium]MCL5031957.1 DUF2934 domain-containing protein [Thermotogota bacterium]